MVGKGGVAGMVAKIAATLVPGLWAMLRAAVKVSVGAVPEGGVAAVKRAVQVVAQVLRASARAASLADSTVRFAGRVAGAPVVGLAKSAASRKALVMPSVLVDVAPRVVAEDAKGARDQAAAAVVSSLSVVKVGGGEVGAGADGGDHRERRVAGGGGGAGRAAGGYEIELRGGGDGLAGGALAAGVAAVELEHAERVGEDGLGEHRRGGGHVAGGARCVELDRGAVDGRRAAEDFALEGYRSYGEGQGGSGLVAGGVCGLHGEGDGRLACVGGAGDGAGGGERKAYRAEAGAGDDGPDVAGAAAAGGN